MRSITKLLGVIVLACTVSGCFWSEKQLSTKFTAAKPLPELNRFARFTRQKDGEWKDTNIKYLVTRSKHGFVYKYSRIDDSDQKDGQFALIALQEPYFALESKRKGGFTYEFYYISADGIYGWTVFENIMKPIKDNPKVQQRLGVSCDNKKCWLSSISTLKNIMSYILSQNIPPDKLYKSISDRNAAEVYDKDSHTLKQLTTAYDDPDRHYIAEQILRGVTLGALAMNAFSGPSLFCVPSDATNPTSGAEFFKKIVSGQPNIAKLQAYAGIVASFEIFFPCDEQPIRTHTSFTTTKAFLAAYDTLNRSARERLAADALLYNISLGVATVSRRMKSKGGSPKVCLTPKSTPSAEEVVTLLRAGIDRNPELKRLPLHVALVFIFSRDYPC